MAWVREHRVLICLLVVHSILLGVSVFCHSPGLDECGHLPSGYLNWKGRFDAYRVNPPLVRMVAAVPLLIGEPTDQFNAGVSKGSYRAEYYVGHEFYQKHGRKLLLYLIAGRMLCLPFSLIGMVALHTWAYRMFTKPTAHVAATFWCFSPNIIAHGSMITPDVAATSAGVIVGFALWSWVRDPSWKRTLWLGLAVSFAVLTKFTWLVLILFIPAVMGGNHFFRNRVTSIWWKSVAVLLIVLYLVNAQYGFKGTGQSLAQLHPDSRALHTLSSMPILKDFPIPVPEDVVLGIDRQKCDFENRFSSYFCGEHRDGGWWNYYVVGLLIKEPIGLWIAFVIGTATFICDPDVPRTTRIILIGLPTIVLVLVSAQTGFNHHLRYVLPAFPFLYILAGTAVSSVTGVGSLAGRHRLTLVALAAFVGSSLYVFPHSLSYFNCVIGGPTNGHRYLINSNIDWGQDLIFLERWLKRNDDPKIDGYELIYPASYMFADAQPIPNQPTPGTWIISADRVHHRSGRHEYFLQYEPKDMIGYSTFVYQIPPSQRPVGPTQPQNSVRSP